jgi:hypothetical protein
MQATPLKEGLVHGGNLGNVSRTLQPRWWQEHRCTNVAGQEWVQSEKNHRRFRSHAGEIAKDPSQPCKEVFDVTVWG